MAHSRDTLLQELRAIEAHEASVQLELFKKAGVYSVLKRIEVWQKRTGKRLSEGFHGGTGEPRSTEPPGLKTVLFSFVSLVLVLSSHYLHTYMVALYSKTSTGASSW